MLDTNTASNLFRQPSGAVARRIAQVGKDSICVSVVVAAELRFGSRKKIFNVHFRNIKGKVPSYREVFVDEGDVDMFRVLRILHNNRYDGVVIPDHTPQMTCDAPWHAGMAYALGFIRAAVQLICQK